MARAPIGRRPVPVMNLGAGVPPAGRVARRPKYSFNARLTPFAITPVALAPVLPGETLKGAVWQSSTIAQGVAASNIGWWSEYYLFYIKHRDLAASEGFQSMMLDPSWVPTPVETASDVNYYFAAKAGAGRINWAKLCLAEVVGEFFRADGVAWDAYTVGGLPAAAFNASGGLLSSGAPIAEVASHDLPLDADASGTITAGEADAVMRQWQFQRLNGLTEMTYEEWLSSGSVAREISGSEV